MDAYELSSVAREEVTEEEITKWQQREELKRQFGKHRAHPSVCVWFLSVFRTPVCLLWHLLGRKVLICLV